METYEIATTNTMYLAPAATLAEATERYTAFRNFVNNLLVKGQDFGEIPGVAKPSLLKPGAEKLNSFFGLSAKFTLVDSEKDWSGQNHNGEPFFYFEYRCDLYRGEQFVASCDGSCNSWEKKYRYRWMNEMDIPSYVDKSKLEFKDGSISEFSFAIDKGETSGKYGKPAEYWKQFRDAVANGTARKTMKKAKDKEYTAYEIGGKIYAVPNHDVADQVNTIQKMAQKRAFVGASLIATNASEFFTQDIEDMPSESFFNGAVIEGDTTSRPAAPEYPGEKEFLSNFKSDVSELFTIERASQFKDPNGISYNEYSTDRLWEVRNKCNDALPNTKNATKQLELQEKLNVVDRILLYRKYLLLQD